MKRFRMRLPRRFAAAIIFACAPLTLRADGLAEQDARFARLPAGMSVLPEKGLAAFQFMGKDGTAQLVPVEGQPFAEAQRVRTTARPLNPWGAQLGARTGAAVKKGRPFARGLFRARHRAAGGNACLNYRAYAPKSKHMLRFQRSG